MGIEFAVLGPLEVRVHDRLVALGGRKQQALLALLLVHANSPLSADRIVEEVWGDDAPGSPLRSVQVYLSTLRAAFGPEADVLRTRSHGYQLVVEDRQVDASRFAQAAREVRAMVAGGEPGRASEVAADALALWRGDPFGELADFPFARAEVALLTSLRRQLVEDRFEAELALGHHRQVVGELEAIVHEHPLHERFRGQLMLALHRCGRQPDALAVYRDARRHLVQELGLEPGDELQDLHQAILRDDPALRVEPIELRARRHLPAPANPLIGRRDEVDEVVAMLRGPSVRLVTATGPGGVGKTRLAVQAAHELADAFGDGVFFVGLAELRAADLVVPTVAAAVGVEEVAEQSLLATIQGYLSTRRVLLLLDNFEQVDEAAPDLGSLLSASPGLKILVTSRSPLRIYGEHEYPVPQLSLHTEAVPLFAARARAADPSFRLTERTTGDVTAVCSRLECLPLAIELAAARAAEFTAKQMLAELPRRLELAAVGPRDLAARQRGLRAAIDWSFDLLTGPEQALFTGLAVFVGGWTPEDSAEVCGASSSQLAHLAAKSLIRRHRREPEGTRFDMLETIREYALERLDDGCPPSGSSIRDRHARHFLALAEAAAEKLRGRDQMAWVIRLEEERDNLRAALSHLLQGPAWESGAPGESGLRLAAALGFFWYKTGSAEEGSIWLHRALDAAPAAPDVLRARALHSLGILTAERGDATQALMHCEESGELFRRAGERAWWARSLNSQGGIARDMGDLARAEAKLVQSAGIRRALGDDQASLTVVLLNLAFVALDQHDLARARTIGEECRTMAQGTDASLHGGTLQFLADVAVQEGDTAQAADLLRRALPVVRQFGAFRLVEFLESCAGLAAAKGEVETAAWLTGAIDAALDEIGARTVPADVRMRERRIAPARTSLGEERFREIRDRGRGLTLEDALEEVLHGSLLTQR